MCIQKEGQRAEISTLLRAGFNSIKRGEDACFRFGLSGLQANLCFLQRNFGHASSSMGQEDFYEIRLCLPKEQSSGAHGKDYAELVRRELLSQRLLVSTVTRFKPLRPQFEVA